MALVGMRNQELGIMEVKLKHLEPKSDKRGWLSNLPEQVVTQTKHAFIATILPGHIRGSHYHKQKTEWIIPIAGKCWLKLIDVASGAITETEIDASQPSVITVPINVEVKVINNFPEPAAILALFDTPFDPENPDVWTL